MKKHIEMEGIETEAYPMFRLDVEREEPSGLTAEIRWIRELIEYRVERMRGNENAPDEPVPRPPDFSEDASPYHAWLAKRGAGTEERVVLALALARSLAPQRLDGLRTVDVYYDQPYSQTGILFEDDPRRVIPTWQTAAFLLYGDDMEARIKLLEWTRGDGAMFRDERLEQTEDSADDIFLRPLKLTKKCLREWIFPPDLRTIAEAGFPARELTTLMEWEDLIVPATVMEPLNEIRLWLEHGERLRRDKVLRKITRPGHRALFHGPPGTGKSMTAALLGKLLKTPVYRADLARITSKWVGETEKNMAEVFDRAEEEKWILLFDEADSLFGVRTAVGNAQDRHANREVSWLLQRMEDYDGLIVLATNNAGNMDPAFNRRFDSVVHFPLPQAAQREIIWRRSFSPDIRLDPSVDLKYLAGREGLSGGDIANIVGRASLAAFADQDDKPEPVITRAMLDKLISREMRVEEEAAPQTLPWMR